MRLVEIVNMSHVRSSIYLLSKEIDAFGPISIATTTVPPIGRAGPSA